MTKQQELARRRAYVAEREAAEAAERARFVADLQTEINAAYRTMLREGWF